jgi:hypothetical protein
MSTNISSIEVMLCENVTSDNTLAMFCSIYQFISKIECLEVCSMFSHASVAPNISIPLSTVLHYFATHESTVTQLNNVRPYVSGFSNELRLH